MRRSRELLLLFSFHAGSTQIEHHKNDDDDHHHHYPLSLLIHSGFIELNVAHVYIDYFFFSH